MLSVIRTEAHPIYECQQMVSLNTSLSLIPSSDDVTQLVNHLHELFFGNFTHKSHGGDVTMFNFPKHVSGKKRNQNGNYPTNHVYLNINAQLGGKENKQGKERKSNDGISTSMRL